MRVRTGTFILSCCVKQCVLLLHNPNRGLAGLALGLGINFFSKSDSILVIDNGSIGEISAHFRMLLIGFWNAVAMLFFSQVPESTSYNFEGTSTYNR